MVEDQQQRVDEERLCPYPQDAESIVREDEEAPASCPYCGEVMRRIDVVVDGVCHRGLCLAEYWKERMTT